MSKHLLYLFGEPGTGKINVARILQERLGWRLFWLHDLDSVCAIVGRYPLPRLMDRISLAVLEELMESGESIIYVRPSRDRETVERGLTLATWSGYSCSLVRLTAERATLVKRISSREPSAFRVSSEAELDRYLGSRPASSRNMNAVSVSTEDRTAARVADEIQRIIPRRTHEDRDKTRNSRRRTPCFGAATP